MFFEIRTVHGFSEQVFDEFGDSENGECGPKLYTIEGSGANDWIILPYPELQLHV